MSINHIQLKCTENVCSMDFIAAILFCEVIVVKVTWLCGQFDNVFMHQISSRVQASISSQFMV